MLSSLALAVRHCSGSSDVSAFEFDGRMLIDTTCINLLPEPVTRASVLVKVAACTLCETQRDLLSHHRQQELLMHSESRRRNYRHSGPFDALMFPINPSDPY